jgi:hypothetical protein
MLRMPQRSVTRFFIPMIDVLTLLFCIYLLMPLATGSPDASAEADARAREGRLRQLERELQAQQNKGEEGALSAKLREEIERLRKEKVKALQQRLAVRVLEIDGKTGKLYYRDPERVEVRDQADALQLIEHDRTERGVGSRELYYLILYPRDRTSAYPTQEQRLRYDRWFQGVALGYDIPGAPGQGGG